MIYLPNENETEKTPIEIVKQKRNGRRKEKKYGLSTKSTKRFFIHALESIDIK